MSSRMANIFHYSSLMNICISNMQVDSSGVQRRLKLKGDPETEYSNRWWQVGNNGGMAATRWLMGLLQECWSLLTIPAVFTWMTHIPVDMYAHMNVYRAFLPPEKTRGPTFFFFKRPFIQDRQFSPSRHSFSMENPNRSSIWNIPYLSLANLLYPGMRCTTGFFSWTLIGK